MRSRDENNSEIQRIEGMGSLSTADIIGLKEVFDYGYKYFARQTYNTKGQKVDRRQLLSATDQANFNCKNKNNIKL
tara:strand:- start:600 stop:827 length:228 start_codon:yes stop_codon:yes gene_type:complete